MNGVKKVRGGILSHWNRKVYEWYYSYFFWKGELAGFTRESRASRVVESPGSLPCLFHGLLACFLAYFLGGAYVIFFSGA